MRSRLANLVALLAVAALAALASPGPVEATHSVSLVDQHDGCSASACPDAPTGSAGPGANHGEITVTWNPATTGGAAARWSVSIRESGTTNITGSSLDGSLRTHTFTGLDQTATYDISVQGRSSALFGDTAIATGVHPKDTMPPTVVRASVLGTNLTVIFNEFLDLRTVPPPGAFTVSATLAGTTRTITVDRVFVGNTSESGFARLLLDEAVLSTETATLDYTRPATGAPRDVVGNELASFTGQAVPQTDTTAPLIASAAANGTTLTLTFNETLDSTSAPAGNSFRVFAEFPDGRPIHNIEGAGTAAISGATVTVTLDAVVERGATLRMRYTPPATSPLQDASGNAVTNIGDRAVTNNAGTLVDQMDGCADATCPNAPTGSAVTGPRAGQITVTWTAATSGGAATKWQLKHTPAGGSTVTTEISDASTRSHTFTGLDATKLHSIVVQGIGSDGTNDKFGDAAQAQGVRPGDTTPPTVVRASVDRTTLSVIFSEHLDQVSIPSTSAFTVSVTRGGVTSANTVDRVFIGNIDDGGFINLILDTAVLSTDTVTVGYTKPAAGALQDFFGNAVATFTGEAVTNNTGADTTAPILSGAVVDGTSLTASFNEVLKLVGSIPPASAFTVSATLGATTRTITVSDAGVANDTDTGVGAVILTLAEGVLITETVTLDYTKPASNALKDQSDNEVATFTGEAVINETTAPTLSSAETNAAGGQINLTFSKNLDNTGGAPGAGAYSVTVTARDGTTRNAGISLAALGNNSPTVVLTLTSLIEHGETATVSYTKPTTGPVLQDAAGNEVASFTDQLVTNNVPDTTAPTAISAVHVSGETTVVITFSENLDTGSTPPAGRFQTVDKSGNIDNILRNGTGISMSAAKVTVTFPEVSASATHVRFTQPTTGNKLQDLAGNAVAAFDIALTGPPAPTVASAVVTGDLLLVTFSEGNLLGDSSASIWTYKVDGVSQGGPSSILTNHGAGTVLLTLGQAVTADQVVLLSFVAFAQNPLRSQAGVAIESFNDLAVTNNTPDEEEDDEVGVSDGERLPVCTAEQANRRQRPGEWPPPNCRGGFYHEWEIPAHLISDPCDQPWQVPGSYRRDRGCLSR